MFRLKIIDVRSNKSTVLTIDPESSLLSFQQLHVDPFTQLRPEHQALSARGLGCFVQGAAAPNVRVSDVVSSGTIIVVELHNNDSDDDLESALALSLGAASSSSSSSSSTWTCQICTLINSNSNSNCMACTTPRSSSVTTHQMTTPPLPAPTSAASTATVHVSTVPGAGSLHGFAARRRAIPSDNSCLFNAVAYLCDGKRGSARVPSWRDNSPAVSLRRLVAHHIQCHPEIFTTAVLDGKTSSEYCQWIEDPQKWGGGIELSILAEHFQCQIAAIDVQTLRPYISGSDESNSRICFVLFNGVHYDAISFATLDNARLTGADAVNSENADVTMVGAEDRENAMEMAVDLAQQLQRSGSFTDLKKDFKVQCLQCYEKFQGRSECVAHAQESGHNQFGEYNGM